MHVREIDPPEAAVLRLGKWRCRTRNAADVVVQRKVGFVTPIKGNGLSAHRKDNFGFFLIRGHSTSRHRRRNRGFCHKLLGTACSKPNGEWR
jgi:hypothetical protein